MGEELAWLNDLAAQQVWGVFEKIWDHIFLSTLFPWPTGTGSNISKGQQKKSSLVQPPGGRVGYKYERKKCYPQIISMKR